MNGIINVLKPAGMSSSGVVQFLKKMLGERRVGHAGTLDMGAAGVLVVLLGRACRLSEHIMGHDKTYLAEMRLGACTDTLDSYGMLQERKRPSPVDAQTFLRACSSFLGDISQIPPDYSAVKLSGRKSYEWARKGISVKKEPRHIFVESIDLLRLMGPDRFFIRIRCSKGTYVRTLITDIAASLGELAYTAFLMRVQSGIYHVQDAYTLDEVVQKVEAKDYSFVLSAESAVLDLPEVRLEETCAFALQNGQAIPVNPPDALFRLYCGAKFYGIGCREAEVLRLKIPLY